ncbi:uncharacterized protein LOC142078565 isoform X2 [Calonectris borealis]|uniref:uncharacterized protein LOC142078565 isoform X2 n=1 Tax=Calonectris borealis TaxID=1323832 RepID=UPI003F4CA2EC
MWGCPSLPADAGLQQAAKQPGGAGDGEGPCSHLHRQHPWRAASLAALSLPGMQEGGAKEAATCSPGLRKHEGLVPSLLAGLARSSLHVRGEAPAAPAEQVPLAVLRGQSCSRVPADGAWSEPSQQRLRELLRCSRPDPGGREERGRLPAPSCPAMAKEEEHPSALSDNQVFALTCIYLPASLLSLLGSGSVLAVTSRQRRCCHIQLRPLFLLALADFLAAAVLLSTATIQLLPAPLFIPAYAACPYGLMLATVGASAHTRGGTGGWAPHPVPPGTAETRLRAGVSPGKSRGGELFLLLGNGCCSPCYCPEPQGWFLGTHGQRFSLAPVRRVLHPPCSVPLAPAVPCHQLWDGKPERSCSRARSKAGLGSPRCRRALPFAPKLTQRLWLHRLLSALPGVQTPRRAVPLPSCPQAHPTGDGAFASATHGDRDQEGLSTAGPALLRFACLSLPGCIGHRATIAAVAGLLTGHRQSPVRAT